MATVKTVEVKLSTTGYEDAKLKIDRLAVASEELSREHPEIKPQIDSAKALMEARLLRDGIKKELSGSAMFGSAGSGGSGSFSNFFGDMTGSGGGALGFLTSPVGIAAAIPTVAALTVELTGLLSGLAAAGTGFGAFGALAIPTFDKIKNAYTGIAAAQQKYNAAVAVQNADPTKTHAKDVATALMNLKIAEDNLSPSTKTALAGINQLKTTYEKMATAFAPDVMKTFNYGLRAANTLLPTLKPLADAAAPAIDGLLQKLGTFFKTSTPGATEFSKGKLIQLPAVPTGFGIFLAAIKQLEGPSITAIGKGLGDIATNLGKLLTTMSRKDVVNAINIAFRVLSGSVTALTWIVSESMITWDQLVQRFKTIRAGLGYVENAILIFTGVSRSQLGRWASDVGHFVAVAVDWFKGLPGRIVSAVGNLGGLLINAGRSIIDGLIAGVQSAIPGLSGILHAVTSLIPSWKGPMDRDRMLLYPNGQAIMGGLIKGIGDTVPALHSQLSGITGSIGGAAGHGTAGGRNYVINVNQLVADKNTGRLVVQAIRQFEQGSGASWRV